MKALLAGICMALASNGLMLTSVHAHGDAAMAAMKAPHGGQLKMAGPYHLELVVGAGELRVYVTDHGDKKHATQGGKASATVLAGKKKTVVKLAPAGDNLFKGSGNFTVAPDMKVVVSVTLVGQAPQQARFTPGKADSGKAEKVDDHAGHAH